MAEYLEYMVAYVKFLISYRHHAEDAKIGNLSTQYLQRSYRSSQKLDTIESFRGPIAVEAVRVNRLTSITFH